MDAGGASVGQVAPATAEHPQVGPAVASRAGSLPRRTTPGIEVSDGEPYQARHPCPVAVPHELKSHHPCQQREQLPPREGGQPQEGHPLARMQRAPCCDEGRDRRRWREHHTAVDRRADESRPYGAEPTDEGRSEHQPDDPTRPPTALQRRPHEPQGQHREQVRHESARIVEKCMGHELPHEAATEYRLGHQGQGREHPKRSRKACELRALEEHGHHPEGSQHDGHGTHRPREGRSVEGEGRNGHGGKPTTPSAVICD